MKRFFHITLLLTLCTIQSLAYDNNKLQDTLTFYVRHHAVVGRVKVDEVRFSGNDIEVYTNQSISYLSLSPALLDTLTEAAKAVVKNTGKVTIFSDGRDVSTLISSRHQERAGKKNALPVTAPLVKNASAVYSAPSGLDGRHIALYGSHGLYYYQPEQRWIWQRAKMFTTVEDLYTTSYTMPFLVPMLENAGAIVIQARERDRQTEEVITDNTAATGKGWSVSKKEGWGPIPDNTLYAGENPFTFGGYAYAECDEDGSPIRYSPAIRKAGEYAVYISYKTLRNSTRKAHYSVMHKGIKTDFIVNQQMGGSTWIYIGTFDFGTDAANNYVEVTREGEPGMVVTSDAIRLGGGMGNVARFPQSDMVANVPSAKENGSQNAKKNRSEGKGGKSNTPTRSQVKDIAVTSGVPRWIEGSRYWFQYTGIPDSVYNYTEGKNDYTDDYASRGRWMNYLAGGSAAYPQGPGLGIPVELGMAFHTDAGTTPDDEIVGTLIIYTDYDDEKKTTFPSGASRMLARDYADYMQTQLVEDVRATYAPEWARRRLHNSSYAESRNPKMPTVLLEFLSHQNFADMKYGLDPSFRFVVSRAIYKGMLRFLHEQYGTPYVVQPLPVKDFTIVFADDNDVTLSWTPRTDQLEETATPTGYVVYTRKQGQDWDNGKYVMTSDLTVTLEPDKQYDFKVCAVNDGGRSFPSEILTARKASNEQGKVLIINGFTRVSAPDHFESTDTTYAGFIPGHYGIGYGQEVNYIGEQFEFRRDLPWQSDDRCGFGTSYNDCRSISPIGNTFDYPTMHGKVLAEEGYSFVSTSVSAVHKLSNDWTFVDVILGKQQLITLGTQKKTTKYECFPANLRTALEGYKGNLLLAGSYIGEEMQTKDDKAWTERVLHYTFSADYASRNGKIQMLSPKGTFQLVTEPNETTIPCERPNGIKPAGDLAQTVARYTDSAIQAGVAYDGDYKQLIFGFALESLTDFATFYKQAIEFLSQEE